MTELTLEHMQQQCQDFNARYVVGDAIKFWLDRPRGEPTHEARIKSGAEILGGRTPIVRLVGWGAIALSHVGGPA